MSGDADPLVCPKCGKDERAMAEHGWNMLVACNCGWARPQPWPHKKPPTVQARSPGEPR